MRLGATKALAELARQHLSDHLIDALSQNGAQTYLVGGAVRDMLLGLTPLEQDYVVVGATPELMTSLGFTQVGSSFPVFLHPNTHQEYALARTEKKTASGHTGFSVSFSPEVSLETDLYRRDLTLNALAVDQTGTLIDPYGGLHDLNNLCLKPVSPAFLEDPLRVFRAARFFAKLAPLKVQASSELNHFMNQLALSGALTELSAERVWQETVKTLSYTEFLSYFELLKQTNCLKPWFTELESTSFEKLGNLKDTPLELKWPLLISHLTTKQIKDLSARLKTPKNTLKLSLHAHEFKVLGSSPDAGQLLELLSATQWLGDKQSSVGTALLNAHNKPKLAGLWPRLVSAVSAVKFADLTFEGTNPSPLEIQKQMRNAKLGHISRTLQGR